MRSILGMILLITLASSLSPDAKSVGVRRSIIENYMEGSPKELFKVYHLVFEKPYDLNSEIGLAKYKIFKRTLEFVKTQNEKKLGWELEINMFADMTAEERNQYTGLLPIPNDSKYKSVSNSEITRVASNSDPKKFEVFDILVNSEKRKLGSLSFFDQFADNEDKIPPKDDKPVPPKDDKPVPPKTNNLSYDFTDIDHTDYLPAIKNQGGCGSCWAFSTAAAVEANENIQRNFDGRIRPSSTQQIVDCTNDGNYGCNGGWMHDAMKLLTNGIVDEVDYTYEGVLGACRAEGKVKTRSLRTNQPYVGCAWASDYFGVPTCNKESWHGFLKQGPLSVILMAEDNLFYYKSGVLDPDKISGCNSYNHAVLAYSFKNDQGECATTTQQVIGIQNSWGEGWGNKGRVLYKYTDSGSCFITQFGLLPQHSKKN